MAVCIFRVRPDQFVWPTVPLGGSCKSPVIPAGSHYTLNQRLVVRAPGVPVQWASLGVVMGEQEDLEQAFRNQNTWFLVPTVTWHLRNSLEVVQAKSRVSENPTRTPRSHALWAEACEGRKAPRDSLKDCHRAGFAVCSA